MSLFKDILKGGIWSMAGQWLVQAMQLVTSIVVARILSPNDYGLFAMSLVVTNFVMLFGNLGFGPALVHKKDLDDNYIAVAFTATFVAAIILFCLVWVAAPFVGSFYGEPAVIELVRVAGIGLLLTPLSAILNNLLVKNMMFKKIAMIDIGAQLVSQSIALVCAFSGFGVWSLVFASLSSHVVKMLSLMHFSQWKTRFYFDKKSFKELFQFGGNLIGFNFINYFARNLDNLIIGKFLGSIALGYYDLAYQIMLKPLHNVSFKLGAPLFAGLTKLQDNLVEAAETYRKVVMTISFITFPMMFGMAAVAEPFISTLLGKKWIPSINVLQILCIVGAMQSIGTVTGAVYKSLGRTDIMLKISILSIGVTAAAFIIGVQWGILGVAVCYGVATLLLAPVRHGISNKLISLPNVVFWKSLLPAVTISLLMVLIVYIFRQANMVKQLSESVRLVVLIMVGIVSYTTMFGLCRIPEIKEFRNLCIQKVIAILKKATWFPQG
jgi:PST family polysaccharide transporter